MCVNGLHFAIDGLSPMDETAASGNYTLEGIAPVDDWKIQFSDCENDPAIYATEFFGRRQAWREAQNAGRGDRRAGHRWISTSRCSWAARIAGTLDDAVSGASLAGCLFSEQDGDVRKSRDSSSARTFSIDGLLPLADVPAASRGLLRRRQLRDRVVGELTDGRGRERHRGHRRRDDGRDRHRARPELGGEDLEER